MGLGFVVGLVLAVLCIWLGPVGMAVAVLVICVWLGNLEDTMKRVVKLRGMSSDPETEHARGQIQAKMERYAREAERRRREEKP